RVECMVGIDIARVGLGTATGTPRGLFALARDRHLPKFLSAVHPRFKTPYLGRPSVAIAPIVVALIVRITSGLAPGTPTDPPGHWFPIFQFGATIGAF